MTTCPLCAAGGHLYDRNCPDCVARDLSRSPKHHRAAAYSAIEREFGRKAAEDMRQRVIAAHRSNTALLLGGKAA